MRIDESGVEMTAKGFTFFDPVVFWPNILVITQFF